MSAREPPASQRQISRRAVTSSYNLPIPLDELADTLAPRNDPSRWNRFVVASIADSNVVAVVAPLGSSGVFRLHGATVYRPDEPGFTVAASGGLRGHGLRITHEVGLTHIGSLHTTVHLATTWSGIGAGFVSRRRVGEWHNAEAHALETRTERNHQRREPLPPRLGHNPGGFAQRAQERGGAMAANTGTETHP